MSKDTVGNTLSLWVATKTNRGFVCGGDRHDYRDHDALRQMDELMQ